MIALLRRLYAIFLRQIYLTIRSVPRFLTQIFWPTINVVIWGFLNQHLYAQNQLVDFTLATLLGATLLNNFFERSNINTMFAFLEDVWARNLGNMVITPIRPLEMMAGYILTGLVNVIIGVGTACILSYMMFDYSLWDMGNGVVPFLVSLIMSGWCIGIILICMIIRYGVTGELLGWMRAF